MPTLENPQYEIFAVARANEKLNTAAGSIGARTKLLEARRLEREMAHTRRHERTKLEITEGYASADAEDERHARARKPPSNRPAAAIEPPTERPLAALPAPADRLLTAVPVC